MQPKDAYVHGSFACSSRLEQAGRQTDGQTDRQKTQSSSDAPVRLEKQDIQDKMIPE